MTEDAPKPTYLGSIPIIDTASKVELLTMCIWGKPSVGKTVLASSAPGRKLWLQFDPNGSASLRRTTDISVADFAAVPPARLEMFKQGGIVEKDLLTMLKGWGPGNTVVVDSLTSLGQMALYYGIASGKAHRGKFKASIEEPGQTGYGVRSAMLLDFIAMVMRVCADTRSHCIFIAHDMERLDDDGKLEEITINLGGQGRSILPAKISELWYMQDDGKRRNIFIRNFNVMRPMRTRMFAVPDGRNSFLSTFDQDKDTGLTIAQLYETWAAAGFNRIPMPA